MVFFYAFAFLAAANATKSAGILQSYRGANGTEIEAA